MATLPDPRLAVRLPSAKSSAALPPLPGASSETLKRSKSFLLGNSYQKKTSSPVKKMP